MARRKVADPVELHNWTEADALLGEIAEKQREVARIELEMNSRIAVLKDNAKAAMKVYQTEIAAGESSWRCLHRRTGRTSARPRAGY